MFDEEQYFELITSFEKTLPKRNDGRIDFTHAKTAAVITIFIFHNHRILLLKRSDQVLTYKGKWNTVAGYLDQSVPIKTKIFEELNEELHITEKEVKSIIIGKQYQFYDQEIKRTWIIYPILVSVHEKPDIILDWEHTRYEWIRPEDITKYDTVPNASQSLNHVLSFNSKPLE